MCISDTVAFTTALQNEMTADDGSKPEGEQQMDTGGDRGDQVETGGREKEEAQKKDNEQVDDDDDDTMNVE